jgi:NTE family protein
MPTSQKKTARAVPAKKTVRGVVAKKTVRFAAAKKTPRAASAKGTPRAKKAAPRAEGTRTALILQGGAALGAYEAGVLRALVESGRRPDIVTGCSIGALMAAILIGSRGDPVETLRDMWHRFAMPVNPFLPNVFARSMPMPDGRNIYRPNPVWFALPTLATHMYEGAPLEAALNEWVDFDKLNASPTEVIVTAVEVKSGALTEFSSHRDGLTARHVVASASLPPVFPATAIDGGEYWDGGLIASTPLRPAINAIERHNRLRRAPLWELIVVDLFTPIAGPPRDLTDVLQRAFELVFFGKFQHDLKLFQWMNAELDLMIEVDRALPRNSPVRRHPAYVKLSQHRRVDKLTIVRSADPQALGGPADFSRESIERRMKMGYEDARAALQG